MQTNNAPELTLKKLKKEKTHSAHTHTHRAIDGIHSDRLLSTLSLRLFDEFAMTAGEWLFDLCPYMPAIIDAFFNNIENEKYPRKPVYLALNEWVSPRFRSTWRLSRITRAFFPFVVPRCAVFFSLSVCCLPSADVCACLLQLLRQFWRRYNFDFALLAIFHRLMTLS